MSAARLIELLSLLQRPRPWAGADLAERLEITPRTVRRDIARLRDLGYPVEATMGASGGYRLAAGGSMPPLIVDDEEAVALAIGLGLAAGQAVAGIEEASVRALTKVMQVLPDRLRRLVGGLRRGSLAPPPGGQPTIDPDDLLALTAAVQDHGRVRFEYVAADGTTSERRVEPHGVVAVGRRWYLVAFDVDRDDWRTFRLDRIGRLSSLGGRSGTRPLPARTPADYVTETLLDLAPTYEAVATLHMAFADATARVGGFAADLVPLDPRSCTLHTHADTAEWLAARLASLGCEFEVHHPPELRDRLRAMGERLARATQDLS